MSIIQGGFGFPYFSVSIYEYICGKDFSSIDVPPEDIPSAEIQEVLKKVDTALRFFVH